jgi:hypothetical protein
MARKRGPIAVVFVDKEWYNSTLGVLADKGESGSTSHLHVLIGPLKDAGSTIGLWLTGFTTRRLKNDGSEVAMEFMVPWQAVRYVGLVDEPNPVPVGFSAQDVTILK